MSLFSQLKSHYTHLLVNWKFCGLGEEATIIKILLTDRRQTTCSKYLFCVLVKMSLLEVGITGVLSCSHPLRHTADTGNISEMNKFNDNKFTTTRWCKFLWHLGSGWVFSTSFLWPTCKPAQSDLVIFLVLLVGIELITVQDCPSIVVSSCQRATVRITHDITPRRLNL